MLEIEVDIFNIVLVDLVYCPTGSNTTSLLEDTQEDDWFHKIWALHSTVPLFLVIICGPIIMVRSPTFFAKFNSLGKESRFDTMDEWIKLARYFVNLLSPYLGTLSVIYITIFVFAKLNKYGWNVSLSDPTSPSYTPLFKSNFPALV
jgi:hypothetical protein